MSQLLHAKHEAFCLAYVRGPQAGSYSDAYEVAGYARDTSNASRLAEQPHIRKRIAELMAENAALEQGATYRAAAALALDKKAVLAELMKIGFANVFDYVSIDDDDRVQVDLVRIEREKGAPIRDIAVEYDDGPDGAQRVKRVRLRLFDKRAALFALGRHLGMELAHRPASARGPAFAAQPQDPDDEEFPDTDEGDAANQEQIVALFAGLLRKGFDVHALVQRAVARADLPPHIARRLPRYVAPDVPDEAQAPPVLRDAAPALDPGGAGGEVEPAPGEPETGDHAALHAGPPAAPDSAPALDDSAPATDHGAPFMPSIMPGTGPPTPS